MSDLSTNPTFEVTLPPSEPPKGEREYQAFLRLLPELLQTHRGQYVAVHEGQVVDADADDIALVRRVHTRIGYVPIHVGLVTEQLPIVRVPHYREYKQGNGS
jgi:hydrogenase maturation factor